MDVGWYQLPKSGRPYHGPIPDGAKRLAGPPEAALADGPAPPAKSAPKADWEAYAVIRGWSPEDAEKATKKHLVEELSAAGGEELVDTSESDEPVGSEVAGADLGAEPLELDTGEGDRDGPVDKTSDDLDQGT